MDVVPNGSGCVETCEVLSDHREDRDDNDPGRGVE